MSFRGRAPGELLKGQEKKGARGSLIKGDCLSLKRESQSQLNYPSVAGKHVLPLQEILVLWLQSALDQVRGVADGLYVVDAPGHKLGVVEEVEEISLELKPIAFSK